MRHLFVIQDNDHIVAETADEALALWTKETGLTLADLDKGMDDVPQIADDLVLQVWVDADGEIAAQSTALWITLISRTAASWAAGNPKGLLFSTEY